MCESESGYLCSPLCSLWLFMGYLSCRVRQAECSPLSVRLLYAAWFSGRHNKDRHTNILQHTCTNESWKSLTQKWIVLIFNTHKLAFFSNQIHDTPMKVKRKKNRYLYLAGYSPNALSIATSLFLFRPAGSSFFWETHKHNTINHTLIASSQRECFESIRSVWSIKLYIIKIKKNCIRTLVCVVPTSLSSAVDPAGGLSIFTCVRLPEVLAGLWTTSDLTLTFKLDKTWSASPPETTATLEGGGWVRARERGLSEFYICISL